MYVHAFHGVRIWVVDVNPERSESLRYEYQDASAHRSTSL
jgi:hypothetical protein